MEHKTPYILRQRPYGEGELRLGTPIGLDPSIYSYSYAMYINDEEITKFMDILSGKVNEKLKKRERLRPTKFWPSCASDSLQKLRKKRSMKKSSSLKLKRRTKERRKRRRNLTSMGAVTVRVVVTVVAKVVNKAVMMKSQKLY
jgi:hypothetical protein